MTPERGRAGPDPSAAISRRQALGRILGGSAALAGAAGVVGFGALGGCSTGPSRSEDPLRLQGTELGTALTKPAATFATAAGEPFDLVADTAGRLSLWFFGYTNCPDVCPVHLGVLAAALDQLDDGVADTTQVCFVGVDTRRDTPARLREFLGALDRDFVGLTASPEVIDRTMAALDLPAPTFDPPAADGSYAVGHPSQILAFTRDDRCHVVYPFGTRRQTWLHDLPLLSELRWRGAPR